MRTRVANNVRIFFSKTPQAKFLLDAWNKNPEEGDGACQYFSGRVPPRDKKEYLVGWLRAYEFDAQEDSNIVSRRNSEKKLLRELSNEWNQTTVDLKKSYQDITDEMETWKNEFVRAHDSWRSDQDSVMGSLIEAKKKQLGELENIYTKKLQLEGPVQYWKARVQSYRRKSLAWIVLLCMSLVALVILLTCVLYRLPSAFAKNLFSGDPEAIKGILILAAVVSFGAYLVRTFSRLAFSALHLQRDSEEREQLTMVYLALNKEGSISDEERKLVLESLFSRAETGLLRRDSSPEMPGLGGMLEKLSGKL